MRVITRHPLDVVLVLLATADDVFTYCRSEKKRNAKSESKQTMSTQRTYSVLCRVFAVSATKLLSSFVVILYRDKLYS